MTTSLSKSTIPAYDPHSSYASPRPVPRVRPEAFENYAKHRGSLNIGDWAEQGRDWESARPVPKVKYEVAQQAYAKNRGCMNELLTGYWEHPPIERKGPRVKKEAEHIFQKNQGNMNTVLHEYGKNIPEEHHTSRAHFEGKYNVEKSRGSMNDLLGNYGRHAQSAKPVARVKYGGNDNLANNRGSGIQKTFDGVPLTNRPSSSQFFNSKLY